MVERSRQSLWKILTGHSGVQNTDLILAEVKANKTILSQSLLYFKPPSSDGESKLNGSKNLTGKKLEFVKDVSRRLVLDQFQSLQLFKSFLLEGYNGSYEDINTCLATHSERASLLTNVHEYYNKERLCVLRCVKQILGYWQDATHPYREVYDECIKVLEINTETFITGVWKQFSVCTDSKIPSSVETLEGEKKWLQQVLLEQCELLEILLLFYKDFNFPTSNIVEKLKLFQSIGFGHQPRGRYTIDMSVHPLACHINSLCVLLLLESFYLEWIHINQNNTTELHKHKLKNFKDSKALESVLLEADHCTPVLLGWCVLCYMLLDEESIEHYLDLMRDCNHVFECLLNILESPFFTGDRPVAAVCKSTINTLVSIVVSLFSEQSLGDLQVLLKISSHLLTHPRLRLEFWDNGLDEGLGVLLVSALKRLPYQLDHVIQLLLSLSQDELSANKLYTLLKQLTSYTEEYPHYDASSVESNSSVVLNNPRTLYEREYGLLGLYPLLMPTNTKGSFTLIERAEEGTHTVVISWDIVYSLWDIFTVKLVQLLHTSGIGLDSSVQPVIDYAIQVIDLTTQILKFDWSIVSNLQLLISQLFLILQKFSPLLHPPVHLISSCINCLTVIVTNTCEQEEEEFWYTGLVQTGFLPTTVGHAKNLQISPGHYSNILHIWERAHGQYPVTTAALKLLVKWLDISSTTTADISQALLATAVHIMQTVFSTSDTWRYANQKERENFCHQLLLLCHKILEKGPGANQDSLQHILHKFTVDSLLYSSGHLLLMSVLGIGVNTVNRLTTSSHIWCQSSLTVESLKLSFKITDMLLQCKTDESAVTPLEQALSTNTVPSSAVNSLTPQHIVTCLASYIYHYEDPAVPVSAIKLLTRLATVAPISMYSCLGRDAFALRDKFITRLSSRTESTLLRSSILYLITVSMGSQPGLLELFLSLKQISKDGKKIETPDVNSCLCAILNMIDPSQQVPPVPSSLLYAGMHLLRTLWEGRHIAALNALRSSDNKFWEHLMTPLYQCTASHVLDQTNEQIDRLHVCAEVFRIIAMELYYVLLGETDKELKTAIVKFISEDSYKKWCQIFQAKPVATNEGDDMFSSDDQVVSLDMIKVQYELAEAWKTFLLVALHFHESLFELTTEGKKRTLLQELLKSLEVQTGAMPLSLPIVNELLSLYLSLLRKWPNVKVPSNVIGRFSDILSSFIRCDYYPAMGNSLPLVYSCLICIVTSLRKNEEELQLRHTIGLVPLVAHTLTHYSQYADISNKYGPEVHGVTLLSELSNTLLEDTDHDDYNQWLSLLSDHSIVMITLQACVGHIEIFSNPDLINSCLSFFLTLSMSDKGSRVLLTNNVFILLNVSLCVIVNKLNSDLQERKGGEVKNLKDLLPSLDWLRVWLTSIKLVTSLLRTQGHYVIEHVINFVGAHTDRLLWVLNIFIATRFMETLEETDTVCQFFKLLVNYRYQWKLALLEQHNATIDKLLNLFNGVMAVLSRDRIKYLIKAMDSQGVLPNGESSTAVKAKDPSLTEGDVWIKHSPAYLRLRDRLLSIATSCLSVLNNYTPPLNDLFMCSSDPSTGAHCVTSTPLRSPSKSSSSPPIKSPITPGIPRTHSAVGQQKRYEILFMLEQAVVLLMSQSVRYLIDVQIDLVHKQALKKQLVSELGNFCQILLLNFHRKGAPSPRTSLRTSSLSGSFRQLDSSSGRASSHSFSEGLEQGLFKLTDLFYKSKILS